jgi:Putative porin
MKQQVIGLIMGLGLLMGWCAPALAEDKKPLEDLLVEKGVITKEDAATLQETVLAKWIDLIKFYGDLRIRHESTFYSGVSTVDRHRQRFRLRLGTDIKIKDVTIIIRLASGAGEAVSTNQTFDNLFTQKELWIDRAYLVWQGSGTKWLMIKAGRMANPFFVPYSSDLMWDDDINPEGFAQNIALKVGDAAELFVNLGQFVLDEDSGDNHDQWMFGQQVGLALKAQKALKATLAAAYYDALNTDKSTLAQNPVQQGNARVGGVLVNRYKVMDVTLVLNVDAGPIPVTAMADYLRNFANTTTTGTSAGTPTGYEGYQLGLIVGKASDANTFEVAYFFKNVQTDATMADISDSDFGNGGIDRRGHIMWVAYNPAKYVQLKVKYFITKTDTPGVVGDVDKLQADVSVKF